MKDALFSALLRLPRFRGRDRATMFLRDLLYRRHPRRGIHGLLVHLDPTEWTQLELFRHPAGQEPLTVGFYGRILRGGDTYVDVGAHIGFHTLVARHRVGPSGRVLAVEPQPYNCDQILANWRANRFENLVVQAAAAGGQRGFISLPHQPSSDRAKLSLANAGRPEGSELSFRVPILPLWEILDQNDVRGQVRLLKIDVEGFETAVLDGLGEAARRTENVLLEVLEAAELRAGDSLLVLRRLRELGFPRWRTVEGAAWEPGQALPENNLWAAPDADA